MKKPGIIIPVLAVAGIITVIGIFSLFRGNKECSGGGSNKNNLIIIVSDALRHDVLGCYGGDAETPNIDRLAGNGVVFENAYSTAPCTLPSSVSMFTGSFSRTYGTIRKKEHRKWRGLEQSFYVPNKEKLLAEALKENGYEVKMDIENKIAYRSNNLQGFEKFRTLEQMTPEQVKRVETETGIRNIGFNKNFQASSKYDRMYGLLYYLLTTPGNRPFFIIKWISDPHAQYNPPEKFRKRIPVNISTLSRELNFYTMMRERMWKVPKNERPFLKHLYRAEVESMDERVGFIIKALKQRGFLENTVIVFTSDHGEAFGEHRRWSHGGAFYDHLVKIPLIFSGPGIPKEKREKNVVSHLDLMPTLKDLFGQEYKDDMQGKSYGALFSGKEINDRAVYFDRITNDMQNKKARSDGLLMNGYKLIVENNQQTKTTRLVLYNLSEDPGETKNLSKIKPGIVKKMFVKLLSIRKENQKRLKKNLAKIGKNVDLAARNKETLEALKTLGYIDD
jgi:arylsulfatase A-like enzyme